MKWLQGILAAAVLLCGAARAAGQPDELADGTAPAGCWTATGGCPARTGATATPGVRGPLAPAWRMQLGKKGDQIATPPLVWHDRIYVNVETTQGHDLHVLGLQSGVPLCKPYRVPLAVHLMPSLWRGTVLVANGHHELRALRLQEGELEAVWRLEFDGKEGTLEYPVLVGDRIYVLNQRDILCFGLTSPEPLWRLKGNYRGDIAVRDGCVYVLEQDKADNTFLVAVDCDIGKPMARTFMGALAKDARAGPFDKLADISVHASNVFVHYKRDLRVNKGPAVRMGWCRRSTMAGGIPILEDGRVLEYDQLPVETPTGWLVTHESKEGKHALIHAKNEQKDRYATSWSVVAEGSRHKAFHRTQVPYRVAGTMAFAGARSFDTKTLRVHWESYSEPRFAPVPARETLLAVYGDREVVAYRPAGLAQEPALFMGPAHDRGKEGAAPVPVTGGVVFRADERFHLGDYEIAGDGKSVTLVTKRGKRERKETLEIGRIAFMLDAEKRLLHAHAPRALKRAVDRYNFVRHAKSFEKFAREAYKTYDADLLAALIEEASARGAPEKRLTFPRKQLRTLLAKSRKLDERRRKKLMAKIGALKSEDGALLARVMESGLDDTRWQVQQIFVRAFLAGGGTHERSIDLVRAQMPDFIPMPARFHAMDWIDFIEQVRHTTAKRLAKPGGESKDLTPLDREYGSALVTWRKDLVALQSEELLILTPLARPGRIAGCLSMGTLVCDALESVFEGGKHIRKDPWPMILRLYENKEEYLAASVGPYASKEQRENMEATVGHYDYMSGFSRMYLPVSPSAWHHVMATYAHELTHHWIRERCPLFKDREAGRSGDQPGYWIVEGMATFVEEFRWDLAARTWDATNPQAESLDIVANAKQTQLIPWERILEMDARAFQELNHKEANRKVPMRWRLGYSRQVSEKRMFYNQAAAACHYLYHGGPEVRGALLRYVHDHYTSGFDPKKKSIPATFEVSAPELGRRIVAYARQQIGMR